MAQFIQSGQLSQPRGSAGDQTPVQNRGPLLAEGVAQVANTVDTLGNIYSQNKAKSIVKEEIENIDRAIATAEKDESDQVPESLKLDQKEWDLLSNAVRNGEMTREKARLIASSRLRTRIAEEPLFADRMRKSASGVLGFNIESESARQYFASLPTEASVASSQGNSVYDEYRELAEADVAAGLYDSVEQGIRFYAKVAFSERQNEMAVLEAKEGVRDANSAASVYIRNLEQNTWTDLSGTVKGIQNQEGGTVKPEQFNSALQQQKQQAIRAFDKTWAEMEAPINSEDYNRHMTRINNHYDSMQTFVDTIGIDNLMKIKLERQNQMMELMGTEMFPQMTFITKTFGQQVASDIFNLGLLNPTRRDQVLAQNDQLRQAWNLLDQDEDKFSRQMVDVSMKLLDGRQLTDEDEAFLDPVAQDLMDNGSGQTQREVFANLVEGGRGWKGLSLLANSSPRLQKGTEGQKNVEDYKRDYEQSLEPAIQNFVNTIAANPELSYTVSEDGVIEVQDAREGQRFPTGRFPIGTSVGTAGEARNLAEQINVFATGHKNGWSRVLGESAEQYRNKVRRIADQAMTQADSQLFNQTQNDLFGYYESGDMENARRSYNKLRNRYPEEFNQDFNSYIESLQGNGGQ